MLLLKSTSGLIIIADLVLVLIVLTVSTHTDLATNAQVCLRNLCAEKDVRQVSACIFNVVGGGGVEIYVRCCVGGDDSCSLIGQLSNTSTASWKLAN